MVDQQDLDNIDEKKVFSRFSIANSKIEALANAALDANLVQSTDTDEDLQKALKNRFKKP